MHAEIVVGRWSTRQEHRRPFPVAVSGAPEQHSGVLVLRVRHPGSGRHSLVHPLRVLEVPCRVLEAAEQVRQDAERAARGVQRDLGNGNGVVGRMGRTRS